MKRILLTMTVLLSALAAEAAQINWGSKGALYDGTTIMSKANGYSTTAYLVYLGSAGATWESFDVVSFANTKSDPDVVAGPKSANDYGVVVATASPYAVTVGAPVGGGTDVLTDGSSTFGVLYLATGGSFGETTHYVTGDSFVYDTTSSNYKAGTSTLTAQSSVPSGTSWTAVPEPSVAIMGLLGIGMLLKRRRA